MAASNRLLNDDRRVLIVIAIGHHLCSLAPSSTLRKARNMRTERRDNARWHANLLSKELSGGVLSAINIVNALRAQRRLELRQISSRHDLMELTESD